MAHARRSVLILLSFLLIRASLALAKTPKAPPNILLVIMDESARGRVPVRVL